MDCTEVERRLSGRSVDELSDEDRAAVAAHVAACEACRGRWGALSPANGESGTARTAPVGDVNLPEVDKLREAAVERTAFVLEGAEGGVAVPQRIGGFEILGQLGSGGMGLVVKARQVTMDRVVALKIMPQRPVQDEAFVTRFIREARSAARLRHPNVVAAYDAGLADGYYFFAMEYVDGESLRDVLRREGALLPDRVVEYAKQTCSALAAAHAAGIVHRDIKPSNLMVDSAGLLRVTDFGLAKRTEGDSTATAEGQLLGTPAYVSPEMAGGDDVDARSDLYSLGATLFHLLAGRPPFEGRAFSEVVIKHISEEPPPLAEMAPHVDRRLCDVVDRLLRKSPDERYPSAQALLEELEALGELACAEDGAPAPAGAETATTLRMDAPSKGRKARAAILVGALAVVAVAACLIVWRPRASSGPSPGRGEPRSLFDGRTLGGWSVVESFPVAPEDGAGVGGVVRPENGQLILEAGHPLTGIVWTGKFPRLAYEVTFDAMRVSGTRDFCILVFPVGNSQCVLEVGAWERDLVGLDTINGLDPLHNGTGKQMPFERGRWYPLRLRVTGTAIAVWVDEEMVIDLPTAGHRFTVNPKWAPLRPFGLGTAWATGAAFRNLTLRSVELQPVADRTTIVEGGAVWHDSGIELAAGRRYEIAATGRWGHHFGHNVGPGGGGEDASEEFPLPGEPSFCLIGRVGTSGAPFVVGESRTWKPKEAGRLCLQMNDSDMDGNVGSLRVSVRPMDD